MNQKSDEKFQKSLKNLKKIMKVLDENLRKKDSTDLERSGIIKNFEMTFELFWKTLQKKAEFQGRKVIGPRDSFALAFKWGLIPDEDLWFKLIEDRNLAVHTYNQDLAKELLERIKNIYFPAFQKLLVGLENFN